MSDVWNLLDFVLVGASVIETIVVELHAGVDLNLSFMRSVRFLCVDSLI